VANLGAMHVTIQEFIAMSQIVERSEELVYSSELVHRLKAALLRATYRANVYVRHTGC
jgi:hypothetical protein